MRDSSLARGLRGDTPRVRPQVEEQMTVWSPGKPGQQEPPKQAPRPLMRETPVEPMGP